MKLFVTPTSPYARLVRIAVIEHGLADRVELIVAETRKPASSYYSIAPSGRVPYLVCDDGLELEESDIICAYFDRIGGGAPLSRPWELDNWAYGRLHALARSFLDGIAVWGRETMRAREDQSATILAHESARALRLADLWEREIDHPLMAGNLNLAQLTLCAGIDSLGRYNVLDPTDGRPRLRAWHQALSERASLKQTHPVTQPPLA